jgi:glycosyltransferase involved in cell wall biosynthesis
VKRVLILIKGLGRGGAEQLLASAAPYLDRSRFEYEMAYVLPWKNALVPSIQDTGLEVHCLDGGPGPGWLWRLRRLVRTRKIDLIHVHSPYAAIGARLIAPGRSAPRLVYTEHNVWSRYRTATYWGNALTYPRNDHVFAVSDSVRDSIRYPSLLGALHMPPVETLYHGLDPAQVSTWTGPDGLRREMGIPEGAPVVVNVANFKPHKGHIELIRAVVEVRRAVPDVRFVLVGVGPLEAGAREEAKRLGVADTVTFAGFREDVPRIVSSGDVFTLASRHEGLSIALMEAMALGRPVVVTRAGGLPEIVTDGVDGLLVPPGDVQELARGLITVLRDAPMRERLGRAARERASRFDIRRTVARVEQVYEEVLG